MVLSFKRDRDAEDVFLSVRELTVAGKRYENGDGDGDALRADLRRRSLRGTALRFLLPAVAGDTGARGLGSVQPERGIR